MRTITLFLLLLLVAGCSPQKRLNRLIKQNPELFNKTTKDSVFVKSFSHTDSTFTLYSTDSIFIYTENSQIKIFRHYDTFTVFHKSDPCTTYVQTQSIAPLQSRPEGFSKTFVSFIFILFLLIILALSLYVLTKK